MFLFLTNAELVVFIACVISICKFHFMPYSTNVYPLFCLAESKQILVSLLGQNQTVSQWLQFARCLRAARRIQKTGPSSVEHQDISSNDDVFAERLGWWRKTTESSRRNCHRLYYQDRIEVSELSVLMQTETMAMQCTAVQIDNLAFDNVLPFLNVSVCSLTRNCWTITLGWIVLKNCMLCLQLWGQLFKIWLISVWVLSTYLQ